MNGCVTGELPRLDVRKDAEDGVLAGAGVDVDAVAGEPGQELRFGLHPTTGRRGRRGQIILWGQVALAGVRVAAPIKARTAFCRAQRYPLRHSDDYEESLLSFVFDHRKG